LCQPSFHTQNFNSPSAPRVPKSHACRCHLYPHPFNHCQLPSTSTLHQPELAVDHHQTPATLHSRSKIAHCLARSLHRRVTLCTARHPSLRTYRKEATGRNSVVASGA
jgi:hypothetical protein